MSRSSLPVVWIAGAPCTGKSTTAWELYTSDISARRRVGYVDIDQLGMVYPAPDDDPERSRIQGRAVGRVLRNFAAAGAESAIVSGVVDPEHMSGYRRECHGSAVTFLRLTADRTTLTDRLRARYSDDGVAAALAFDARLDEADFPNVVDTTGPLPAEVAERVSAVRPASRAGTAGAARHHPVSGTTGVCVWIHGAPAVGKSSVAWSLFMQLVNEGGAGYVDVGQLSFIGGLAADDEALLDVQAANVAAAWDVFAETGARWLVMSGALTRSSDLQSYQDLLPNVDFRPVRLTASDDDIRTRVLLRGQGNGPNLAGDLLMGQPQATLDAAATAARGMAHRLAACALPGPVVDTTGASVETTVALVRDAVGT